jgi:hypothetical protein
MLTILSIFRPAPRPSKRPRWCRSKIDVPIKLSGCWPGGYMVQSIKTGQNKLQKRGKHNDNFPKNAQPAATS